MMICERCQQSTIHFAKGLCRKCYNRQYHRAHYRRNKNRILRKNRLWAKKNPEKVAIISHRCYIQDPDKAKKRLRKWQRENPDKVAAQNARRRARKKAVAETLTTEQLEFERRIAEATYPGERLELHHLVPLAKQGNHSWGNIIFLPISLNRRIGAKLPQDVYRQLMLI